MATTSNEMPATSSVSPPVSSVSTLYGANRRASRTRAPRACGRAAARRRRARPFREVGDAARRGRRRACVTKIAAQRAPVRASSSRSSATSPPGSTTTASGRAALGPHDVAVRADRSQLVAVDDERHDAVSLTAASYSASVQSWNLNEIETPGGSRSPVVVDSKDEARAVLIGLDPGQALGDHQVHERSWVVVLEGRVQHRERRRDRRRRPGLPRVARGGRAPVDLDRRRARGSCCCSRRGPARATTTPRRA